MDGNHGDSRASRIPPTQQGSSSRASSPSASLAAISEQSALMTTEEFSDIAHHASETAKAILGDIGGSGAPSRVRASQRSPPPSPAGVGGSRKYLTPKWRAGRVNSIGLLDMDEESVLTVGSYEGDVLGMSMSLDEADIFRLSGWNRAQLEDIQSVGSREEHDEGGTSSQQQQQHSPERRPKSNLRTIENESWSSFGGSSEDNDDRGGNAGGRDRGRVFGGEGNVSQLPEEKEYLHQGERNRQQPRLGISLGLERRGSAHRRPVELPSHMSDMEGSGLVNRGSDESLSYSFGREGLDGSCGEAEVGQLDEDSSSKREGFSRGDSFNFNSTTPTPTAAHVEMASVVKIAEGEVAELRRQVHQKNSQLDMAQAALLEYEEEIQKLYKRVRETGRSSRRHGSQELVLTELAKVKSETSSLASQISRSISFTPTRMGGGETGVGVESDRDGALLMELETLRSQNAVLTTQLQNRVAREQLDQLEKEVSAVHANRDALEEELALLRDDKSRLQSQLLEAQEEAISILNETHDADEEVQVYMRRLVECQNQRDTLERNLHRTEADLSNLQKENMQLKAEARAWKARSGDVAPILSVNEMNMQMEKMVAELDAVVDENHGLRGELEALRVEAAETENSRAADVEKIEELRKALAVAIEVNNCLKEQVEELDGDSDSERRFEESLTNHKLQQMQEALQLALEAKNLLEERVIENEEVSTGLKFLQSEVMGLEVDLHGEQQEMQEKYAALVESKQECVQELSQVREALGLALQAKTELESRLDREAQVVQELRSRIDELERRLGDGRLPVRSKLDVAHSTSMAGSAETQIGVAVAEMEFVDSPIGPGGSPAELGGFSRPGQVQGSRLEEVEKQLQDALQEKSKLLDRLSGISTATAELEKVMKEDVKGGSHNEREQMGVVSAAAGQESGGGGGLGKGRGGDEEDESGSRGLSNSKGPSSANRSRTVTIYTHQLRNLRREIRELTAENKKLQDECDANKGREDAFYVELEKLQEELAGALQHKESLASQFREFGHVRKRLVSEIDSLKRTLDEERMKSVMAEEAVDDFRALHMDMLRIMGSGSQVDDIGDVPMQLPDCIRYWAKKIREDMVSLVSNPSMLPPPPSPVRSGRESPHAADVVVSAQAHAEFDEPSPSPSRHSNLDARSQMMTVLKNDFRDLRVDEGYENIDDSPSAKQLDSAGGDPHSSTHDSLTFTPIGHEGATEYAMDEWEDDREGIYGGYDAEDEVGGRHHHQHHHRELPPSLQGILDLSNIPEELVTVTETEEEGEEEQQEREEEEEEEEEDKTQRRVQREVPEGSMKLRSVAPLTPREVHHHTDSVGISLTETDESPRISEDRNPGHESEHQQDPVASRISFQDVLDNLEGEIEMLRQEKNRLSPTEEDPTDDDSQQLTRELSRRIVELQGWADEIEAALVTKSEDLDTDINGYQQSQVSWVEG